MNLLNAWCLRNYRYKFRTNRYIYICIWCSKGQAVNSYDESIKSTESRTNRECEKVLEYQLQVTEKELILLLFLSIPCEIWIYNCRKCMQQYLLNKTSLSASKEITVGYPSPSYGTKGQTKRKPLTASPISPACSFTKYIRTLPPPLPLISRISHNLIDNWPECSAV